MEKEVIEQIEEKIGYTFNDKNLLMKSFIHCSAVDNRLDSNERLEFLGDSVLGLVICHELFRRFKSYLEGDMTKVKSMLVSRKSCSKVIKDIGIIEFLKLGKGMIFGKAINGSIAASLLEGIIAAIYLDGGLEPAREFILMLFGPMIDKTSSEHYHGNYKSILQQHSQQNHNITPRYIVLDEQGPDHNKCFEIQAAIEDKHYSSAWGMKKKDAEQKAAYNALVEIGLISDAEEFAE